MFHHLDKINVWIKGRTDVHLHPLIQDFDVKSSFLLYEYRMITLLKKRGDTDVQHDFHALIIVLRQEEVIK
jgi:hypothetical protein